MPMPRLPEIHHRKTANQNAFQVKKKKAASAPIWNAIMKEAVIQLMCSSAGRALRRSCSSMCLVVPRMRFESPQLTAGKLAGVRTPFCNSYVIAVTKVLGRENVCERIDLRHCPSSVRASTASFGFANNHRTPIDRRVEEASSVSSITKPPTTQ